MATLLENAKNAIEAYGCKNVDLALNYYTRMDNELRKLNRPWNEINLQDFKIKAIAYANIGIDPLAAKMLSFTMFKNNQTNVYDVVFVEDVRCMEILARRYGKNCPENITVELIYSTDNFSPVKKGIGNPNDSYILEIKNPFERGEIIGGVSLSEYANPVYNKVRFMSIKDIEKRVRTNSTFWKNWKEEMCEKTIGKNAWGKVVLDTTELAEFYQAKSNDKTDYELGGEEELPFTPEDEL